MNPQSITISGRPFFKYRAQMDATLNKSIEKMLAAGVNEGTVMGQIAIRLIRSEDEKTGEIQIRPQFVFNTTMSIPVKVSDKDAAEEDFIIFKDKGGKLKICDQQVTMDDILANSEIVDEDPEADLAARLAEGGQDDADDDPDSNFIEAYIPHRGHCPNNGRAPRNRRRPSGYR